MYSTKSGVGCPIRNTLVSSGADGNIEGDEEAGFAGVSANRSSWLEPIATWNAVNCRLGSGREAVCQVEPFSTAEHPPPGHRLIGVAIRVIGDRQFFVVLRQNGVRMIDARVP